MTSTFDRQLAPCARNGIFMRPAPVATGNSSPPIPRTIGGKSAPDRMREHETPVASPKPLIANEDREASLQLRDRLSKADRERKRIRHAFFLMATLFILALAGLSYCALLAPQVFFNPEHFITTSLSFLGLASLIAQLEFFGYLLWHRSAVNRLHKELRRRVRLLVESQLRASLPQSLSAGICHEPGSTLASAPVE